MIAESGFEARAGTLTLLCVGGAFDYEGMLELVERGIPGGPQGGVLPAEDEFDAYEDELDEEPEIGPDTLLEITPKGEGFLFVTKALERWLSDRPGGPPHPDPCAADSIGPLICAWSATLTHALAAQPLEPAEIERAVSVVDGETVEELLEAMELAGQVEARPGREGTRYALTEWGREGIAPLVAAVQFERRFPEAARLPPDILDVESAFQLALPLLELPPELHGACRLGVRIPDEKDLIVGATANVDRGRVVSSSTLLEREPRTWVTGSPIEWCDAVIDPTAAQLEAGGDLELADALLAALHERLFA